MQKRRVLSLILAVLLFLTTSPMDVRAAGGGAWEWENENNYEGWSHNNQIDATCVADGWYRRLETLVNRFNIEHMQGGNQLYYGEKNQHGGEGNVGIWGEFPESGLVPVAAKDGFMGISADKDGLHITPNLPSSDMTTLSLSNIDYWGMKLNISVSATSVRIYAVENNSPYTDWSVNGTAVSGSFDIIVPIQAGESVTLSRATNTYDLSME